MPSQKRKFGDMGEKLAERYLLDNGYRIIDRNYWKPWGEIDIIGTKKNLLVFFEVKTREIGQLKYSLPEEAVNQSKQVKLKRICNTYLADKKYPIDQEWQIDIVSVSFDKNSSETKIDHFENAVWDSRY